MRLSQFILSIIGFIGITSMFIASIIHNTIIPCKIILLIMTLLVFVLVKGTYKELKK